MPDRFRKYTQNIQRVPELVIATTKGPLITDNIRANWNCFRICYNMHNNPFAGELWMYTVSKAKKGVKYKVIGLDEFWTKKRLERFARMAEPVPNLEEYLRFMRERMGSKVEEIRVRHAKRREQEAKLAGQKGTKHA